MVAGTGLCCLWPTSEERQMPAQPATPTCRPAAGLWGGQVHVFRGQEGPPHVGRARKG